MKSIKKLFGAASDFTLLLVISLIAGCAISGCASIGAAPAQSFSEQLAYGYGGVASVRNTCQQQLAANSMALPTAQKCLVDTDAARAGLDAAYAASSSGDQPKAIAAITAATSILTQLQSYLTAKGK